MEQTTSLRATVELVTEGATGLWMPCDLCRRWFPVEGLFPDVKASEILIRRWGEESESICPEHAPQLPRVEGFTFEHAWRVSGFGCVDGRLASARSPDSPTPAAAQAATPGMQPAYDQWHRANYLGLAPGPECDALGCRAVFDRRAGPVAVAGSPPPEIYARTVTEGVDITRASCGCGALATVHVRDLGVNGVAESSFCAKCYLALPALDRSNQDNPEVTVTLPSGGRPDITARVLPVRAPDTYAPGGMFPPKNGKTRAAAEIAASGFMTPREREMVDRDYRFYEVGKGGTLQPLPGALTTGDVVAHGQPTPNLVAQRIRGCSRCRRRIYEGRSFCSGCGDGVTSFTPEAGERVG